jgi:hypothetical protein
LCIAGIKDEHATEVVRLSQLVIKISDALINLGVFPIREIPRLPNSAQQILASYGLILEHL